jgi:hypothetical protein
MTAAELADAIDALIEIARLGGLPDTTIQLELKHAAWALAKGST